MATTNGPSSTGASLIDTEIFTSLQAKIDEESEIRDQLKALVENLSKQGRLTQSILSRIHNVPSSAIAAEVLDPSKQAIQQQVQTVQTLATEASKYPFYKWNQLWQRDIQHLISSVQLHRWLETGQLVTVEDVGSFFNGELPQHKISETLADQSSPRQRQRPRYLPHHDRRLPPRSLQHDRRASATSS